MRLRTLMTVTLATLVAAPATALAQGEIPPTGTRDPAVVAGPPAVVSLGDSAISGEAGRWAGNTNQSYTRIDALGPTAYNEVSNGEAVPGCHPPKSAEGHLRPGWGSAHPPRSGARPYSHLQRDRPVQPRMGLFPKRTHK